MRSQKLWTRRNHTSALPQCKCVTFLLFPSSWTLDSLSSATLKIFGFFLFFLILKKQFWREMLRCLSIERDTNMNGIVHILRHGKREDKPVKNWDFKSFPVMLGGSFMKSVIWKFKFGAWWKKDKLVKPALKVQILLCNASWKRNSLDVISVKSPSKTSRREIIRLIKCTLVCKRLLLYIFCNVTNLSF